MGLFPYTCEECSGAYDRCARNCEPGEGCEGKGGQFCWEEDVVCIPEEIQIESKSDATRIMSEIFLKIEGKPLFGTYNGYGDYYLEVTPELVNGDIDLLISFNALSMNKFPSTCFVDEEGASDVYNCIIVTPYCRSCYMGES